MSPFTNRATFEIDVNISPEYDCSSWEPVCGMDINYSHFGIACGLLLVILGAHCHLTYMYHIWYQKDHVYCKIYSFILANNIRIHNQKCPQSNKHVAKNTYQ